MTPGLIPGLQSNPRVRITDELDSRALERFSDFFNGSEAGVDRTVQPLEAAYRRNRDPGVPGQLILLPPDS